MFTDTEILKRMDDITAELAQLKHIGSYNVSLSEAKPKGSVHVSLTHHKGSVDLSWDMGYEDPLSTLGDALGYSNVLTPRSASTISEPSVKNAYLNEYGYIVINHEDGSQEEFKCKKEDQAKVISLLQDKLGDKFKNNKK